VRSPQKAHTYGGFVWPIRWQLRRPALKGGFIIQHITVDFSHVYVSDKRINGKPVRMAENKLPWKPTSRWRYYEAWAIEQGARGVSQKERNKGAKQLNTFLAGLDKLPKSRVLDDFRATLKNAARDAQNADDWFTLVPGPDDSEGYIVFKGDAYYVDGITEDVLGDEYKFKVGANKNAGGLLSTATDQGGVMNSIRAKRRLMHYQISNMFAHRITIKWPALGGTNFPLGEKNP